MGPKIAENCIDCHMSVEQTNSVVSETADSYPHKDENTLDKDLSIDGAAVGDGYGLSLSTFRFQECGFWRNFNCGCRCSEGGPLEGKANVSGSGCGL